MWRLPSHLQAVNDTPIEVYNRYLFSRNGQHVRANFNTEYPNILVVGDSQASDFINLLSESGLSRGLNVKLFPIQVRCGALIIPEQRQDIFWNKENIRTVAEPGVIQECRETQHEFATMPELADVDLIVLASLWHRHAIPYIKTTVDTLKLKSNARIAVVWRKTQELSSIDIANTITDANGRKIFASKHRSRDTDEINHSIREMIGDNFIDLVRYLCPSQLECHVLTETGKPILFDRSHLSPEGAAFLGNLLVHKLRPMLRWKAKNHP